MEKRAAARRSRPTALFMRHLAQQSAFARSAAASHLFQILTPETWTKFFADAVG